MVGLEVDWRRLASSRLTGPLQPLVQKPNSWTYNFVKVSGHNLKSSQTC